METTINDFGQLIYDLQKSDNDVNMAVAGMTGKGKSTFLAQLMMAHSKITGIDWGFDHMTWSRKELITWIDGEDKSKPPNPITGLRKGQLPEYSGIMPDELYAMFCAKTWYNENQIDAVTTFNTCRDRHLFVGGAVPNFWELDGSFQSRIRFYVYIPNRGTAWVFEQEDNPFTKNQWNPDENKKILRKAKHPYKCPNFLFSIDFPDWTEEMKLGYYKIRNKKRLSMYEDTKTEKKERYTDIKNQRDKLINMLLNQSPDITQKDIGEAIGISKQAISLIRNGLR